MLQRALALEPGLEAARQLVLETCLGRGREALEDGRFEEAREYFRTALSVDPQGYEPIYQAAVAAVWLDDYEAADSLLRKAIDWHPDVLELRWHLRLVTQHLGKEAARLPEKYRFRDAVAAEGDLGGTSPR